MAIMKTYSNDEMEYLHIPLKNDEYKLLIQPERLNPEDINLHALKLSEFLKKSMQKEIDDVFDSLNS